MSSPSRVIYTPRSDTSPELEAAALAAAYRYILDCHAKKKTAETDGGEDDVEGGDHEEELVDASEQGRVVGRTSR
jgi:hypothetical protein